VGRSLWAHSTQALKAEGDEAGGICSAHKGLSTSCRDDVRLGPSSCLRSSGIQAGPRVRALVTAWYVPPRGRNTLQTATCPRDSSTLQAVRRVASVVVTAGDASVVVTAGDAACRSHGRGPGMRRSWSRPGVPPPPCGWPGRTCPCAAPAAPPPPPLQEKTTQTCRPAGPARGHLHPVGSGCTGNLGAAESIVWCRGAATMEGAGLKI
jgi:hypothetical protein